MKDLTKLTSRQISQIKNIYKANSSIYSRIETLQKHLYKIQEELDEQLAIIEANEAGVKMLTGGFISKQLIKDEQIPQFNEDGTPKMDKEGKYQVKNQVLTFHAPIEIPLTEGTMGSDYDVDSEAVVDEDETEAVNAAFNPIENI